MHSCLRGARVPACPLSRHRFSVLSRSKFTAPPMVYIAGEEMTHYTMNLIIDKWVKPFCDTSKWEHYDLSCKARDDSEDKVLHDAVAAGKRICAIFKEPTITPTEVQKQAFGLKKTWGSPNGAMRRGWNGITISRDTIHIPGVKLGFKNPVLFERHAVGGEYGAGFKKVGKGRVLTTFFPDDISEQPVIIDGRQLDNDESAVVVYDNPIDNVKDLAHIFFTRCLEANIIPYVVTKKTVFKWQESFWVVMKQVFDADYVEKYKESGLLDKMGGDLQHLISDAATMQIIRWTDGGFGMACHNYDGDMLTDEVAQVHRSPGFITSNLVGKREDGTMIKEFEASHGTVADMYAAHLRGEETSLNPLGMAVALLGAMEHAAFLEPSAKEETFKLTAACREAMYSAFREGRGTRDLNGPSGLTTEKFIESVGADMAVRISTGKAPPAAAPTEVLEMHAMVPPDVDEIKMKAFFDRFDSNKDGKINFSEFAKMSLELGVAPLKVADVATREKHFARKAAREAYSAQNYFK